ncbi:MAG: regulatory iron-sulfur-containing complex subunit RicT [Spirochaetaceae bacterium]
MGNNKELEKLEDDVVVKKQYKKKGERIKEPLYKIKLVYSCETEVSRIRKGISIGDNVVVNSRYGKDMAIVLGIVKNHKDVVEEDLIPVLRVCNERDIKRLGDNKEKETKAYSVCKDKIRELSLDMKLTGVHYLLDEPKILFYFTADNRVDFRELVKSLVSIFKMRIELRQIGVRDESRLLGGMGVCGRVICCHGLTDSLKPVSIKMAKEQNLSLNSMKISGPCGRLLCCLEYEYDFYESEKSKLPSQGSRIKFKKELLNVDDVNLFSRSITVSGYERSYVKVSFDNIKKNKGKWEILKFDVE